MPLSFNNQSKINPRIKRIREAVFNLINSYIGADKIFLLFFIVATILTFMKIRAFGFYLIFSLFVVGYFIEKIINKVIKRK